MLPFNYTLKGRVVEVLHRNRTNLPMIPAPLRSHAQSVVAAVAEVLGLEVAAPPSTRSTSPGCGPGSVAVPIPGGAVLRPGGAAVRFGRVASQCVAHSRETGFGRGEGRRALCQPVRDLLPDAFALGLRDRLHRRAAHLDGGHRHRLVDASRRSHRMNVVRAIAFYSQNFVFD